MPSQTIGMGMALASSVQRTDVLMKEWQFEQVPLQQHLQVAVLLPPHLQRLALKTQNCGDWGAEITVSGPGAAGASSDNTLIEG